jgi:hypothetical protein
MNNTIEISEMDVKRTWSELSASVAFNDDIVDYLLDDDDVKYRQSPFTPLGLQLTVTSPDTPCMSIEEYERTHMFTLTPSSGIESIVAMPLPVISFPTLHTYPTDVQLTFDICKLNSLVKHGATIIQAPINAITAGMYTSSVYTLVSSRLSAKMQVTSQELEVMMTNNSQVVLSIQCEVVIGFLDVIGVLTCQPYLDMRTLVDRSCCRCLIDNANNIPINTRIGISTSTIFINDDSSLSSSCVCGKTSVTSVKDACMTTGFVDGCMRLCEHAPCSLIIPMFVFPFDVTRTPYCVMSTLLDINCFVDMWGYSSCYHAYYPSSRFVLHISSDGSLRSLAEPDISLNFARVTSLYDTFIELYKRGGVDAVTSHLTTRVTIRRDGVSTVMHSSVVAKCFDVCERANRYSKRSKFG